MLDGMRSLLYAIGMPESRTEPFFSATKVGRLKVLQFRPVPGKTSGLLWSAVSDHPERQVPTMHYRWLVVP